MPRAGTQGFGSGGFSSLFAAKKRYHKTIFGKKLKGAKISHSGKKHNR